MIVSYGFTLAGTSHLAKGLPCQDAYCIFHLPNGWVAAAVADGVGSSPFAEQASIIAVENLLLYRRRLADIAEDGWDEQAVLNLMKDYFAATWQRLCDEACRENVYPHGFNTTLTAIVYNGSRLAFAHCGDSGAIGLASNGCYYAITAATKGEEFNSVIPLNAGADYWVFGCPKEDYCSVLLLTDGLLDIVQPSILQHSKDGQRLYVRFLRQIMDAGALGLTADKLDEKAKEVEAYFQSAFPAEITDDKTLVSLINLSNIPPVLEVNYYEEPDWEQMRKELQLKLYG